MQPYSLKIWRVLKQNQKFSFNKLKIKKTCNKKINKCHFKKNYQGEKYYKKIILNQYNK